LFGKTNLPDEKLEPSSKFIHVEMPTAKPVVVEPLHKTMEVAAEIKGHGDMKSKNESDSIPYQTGEISSILKEEPKSDPTLHQPKANFIKGENTQDTLTVKNESSQELKLNSTEKKSIFSKIFTKRNKKEKNVSLIDVDS
jgi:hypothetical protein